MKDCLGEKRKLCCGVWSATRLAGASLEGVITQARSFAQAEDEGRLAIQKKTEVAVDFEGKMLVITAVTGVEEMRKAYLHARAGSWVGPCPSQDQLEKHHGLGELQPIPA